MRAPALVALSMVLAPASGCAKSADSQTEFQDCDSCPVMVVVPAGAFTMGSPNADGSRRSDEGPAHQVSFANAFAVGKYEVTRSEYAAFANAGGHGKEDGCYYRTGLVPEKSAAYNWRDPGYPQTDEHPVVCVSRSDALSYAVWLSEETGEDYQLVNEAQWEYVVRAGTQSERPWGELADDGCGYANGADITGETDLAGWKIANCEDGYTYTAPVGSFKANAFGVYDMLGNVAEWVADCWNETYAGAPIDGSAWMTGDCTRPILRGASWHDDPKFLRSANRYGFYAAGADSANARYRNFGFRVARTVRSASGSKP